jgi:hypothetical protein
MTNTFINTGIAGFKTAEAVADATLLFSHVPPLGNQERVAVTAALPQYSLIKADGTLAEATETAVGVTSVEITAARVAKAAADSTTIYATYYKSGNFLLEGINVDTSLTTLALAKATVAASATLAINSNTYAAADQA